jgi:thioredoxin 1
MAMTDRYQEAQPSRADVDALRGGTVLEFGTNWCGFCIAAQTPVAAAFAEHPRLRHMKVEDGSGRLLGRSFRIKLWPTLIFLLDGKEVSRLVRPGEPGAIAAAMKAIDS